MSKTNYTIRFDNKEDYEKNKDKILTSSEYYTISTKNNFWVLHYLTFEEYDLIKSYGISISLDDELLTTL